MPGDAAPRKASPAGPAHGTESLRRITPPVCLLKGVTPANPIPAPPTHPRGPVRLQESTRKDRTGPPAPAFSLGSPPEASEPLGNRSYTRGWLGSARRFSRHSTRTETHLGTGVGLVVHQGQPPSLPLLLDRFGRVRPTGLASEEVTAQGRPMGRRTPR